MVKKKTKAKKKPTKKKAAKPKETKLQTLVSACKLWDRITTKANDGRYTVPDAIDRFRNTLYNSADYHSLECRVTGDKAELTVGGSAGHKAKIDLEKKTFKYYDNRDENNRAIWLILKSAGLSCKRDFSGVECKNVNTKAKINGAFKAMASPASMDYRRSFCANRHSLEECRNAELKFFNFGPKKEK